MSCPVCNRTMQNLGSPERRIWWCATCGTLKEESGDFVRIESPANVRAVIRAARLSPTTSGATRVSHVDAMFDVTQANDEAPKVEMRIIDSVGRRVW